MLIMQVKGRFNGTWQQKNTGAVDITWNEEDRRWKIMCDPHFPLNLPAFDVKNEM